jgi:hypothetical protein
MTPTYTMSAHLCKQIYASWRQQRQHPDISPPSSPIPSTLKEPSVRPPTIASIVTPEDPRRISTSSASSASHND